MKKRMVNNDTGLTLVLWSHDPDAKDQIAEAERALGGSIPPGSWRIEREVMKPQWESTGLKFVVPVQFATT